MNRNVYRVMLVEDNPDHAELVRRVLQNHRIPSTIDHFADGREALDFLLGNGSGGGPPDPLPDVMLLDLRLTRVDGLEVLKVIKEHERLRAIPVVILTSSEASRDIAAAYQRHANSYLVKPVGYEGFVELMEDLGSYWLTWNTPAPLGAVP